MRDGELGDNSSGVLTSNTQVFKGTYPSHLRPLFVHFKQKGFVSSHFTRRILQVTQPVRTFGLCARVRLISVVGWSCCVISRKVLLPLAKRSSLYGANKVQH